MDERAFVEQRKASWEALSETVDRVRRSGGKSLSRQDLSALGGDYRALVSDLSFARTQRASEDLIRYLNELAGRTHGVVYRSGRARLKGIAAFLFRDFPALFRRTACYTLVAALVFGFGWFLAAASPEISDLAFPRQISQAPQGGKSDSPLFGIDPSLLSGFIMTNNIRVGIHAFAGGVTAGAYTVYQLAQNGLVIGAVATKAVPVMGPLRFWSLILPHGIIELMAIFISGGAGLLMGASIIAPGNLRRSDAIKMAAGNAVRLFAVAVVLFVVAGLIEGFVTPSALPQWSKLAFAGLTAVALSAYLGLAGRKDATAAPCP